MKSLAVICGLFSIAAVAEMGFQPRRIRHLVEAERYGLGTLNPKVLGESIESTAVRFKQPPYLKSTALTS